jgi:hypothetical protein
VGLDILSVVNVRDSSNALFMMGFTCSINNYRADLIDVPYSVVPLFASISRTAATVLRGLPQPLQTSRNLPDVCSGCTANTNGGRLERWDRLRTRGTKHCLTIGIAQSVQWLYTGLDDEESAFDSQQMQTIFSPPKCPGPIGLLLKSTGSSSAGGKESQEWK